MENDAQLFEIRQKKIDELQEVQNQFNIYGRYIPVDFIENNPDCDYYADLSHKYDILKNELAVLLN